MDNNQNKLAKMNKAKNCNLSIICDIIDVSLERIKKQGNGCVTDELSADYVNVKTRKRDSIGVLIESPDKYLNKFFGPISDKEQAPLITQIALAFSINPSIEASRSKLVYFLQKLQDAHDKSFLSQESRQLPLNKRMDNFEHQCINIKNEVNLHRSKENVAKIQPICKFK